MNRPRHFRLTGRSHSLKTGLVFAGLGRHPGSGLVADSSLYGQNAADAGNGFLWEWVPELGRWGLKFASASSQYLTLSVSLSSTHSFALWANAFTASDCALGGTGANQYLLYRSGNNLITRYGISATQAYADASPYTGWQHWAVTRDGTNVTIYKNGTSLVNAVEATAAITPTIGEIAAYQGGTLSYNGTLVDPMCADRVWSPAEIQILADRSDPMYQGLLQPLRRSVVRGWSPPAEATTTGGVRLRRRRQLTQRPRDFKITSGSHSLKTGLAFAGLGRHSGSTHYHDSSLYGHNGTLTNMDPATDWVFDSEINRWRLDFVLGSSQYIEVSPAGGPFNRFPGEMSVAMWLKPASDYTTAQWLAGNSRSNWASADFGCSLGWTNNKLDWSQTGPAKHWTPDYTISDDEWRHILFTRAGSSGDWDISLYVNGVFHSTGNTATNPGGSDALSGLSIARPGTYAALYLSGSLADVMIWSDRVLGAGEAAILANKADPMLGGLLQPIRRSVVRGWSPPAEATTTGGVRLRRRRQLTQRPRDFKITSGSHSLKTGLVFAGLGRHSGSTHYHDSSLYSGHDGTFNNMDGGDWVWNQQLGRWGVSGDGAAHFISVPIPFDPSGSWTVACWVAHTPATTSSGPLGLDDNPNNRYLYLSKIVSPIWRMTGTSGIFDNGAAPTALEHLLLQHDGTQIEWFIDGVSQGSDTPDDGDWQTVDTLLILKCRTAFTHFYFDGDVFDMMCWQRTLAAGEQQLLVSRDPMYGGLLQPIRRRGFVGYSGAAPSFGGINRILGGGIVA